MTDAPGGPAEAEAPTVTFTQSPGLAARLAELDVSVLFSSYQSGLFYALGRKADGGTHVHQAAVIKPMGIATTAAGGFALSSARTIMRFGNGLEPHERVNDMFDACYVARQVHYTGYLDAHDLAIDKDGQAIFVNTRFNCLATVDPRHSFREVWRPPFISELIDEDRCHLNGLAMDNGEPAYVTAVSQSNSIDGWRDRRANGGVVVDVRSNRIICKGLSMPHSPRIHQGRLWVLNSGTGELGVIEDGTSGVGRFVPRAFCPGFLRGLAFHGRYAFVGLSKPRYQRFEGLALDQRLADADSEPWCGIQIIDLEKNTCVDWFRIDGAVAELYDVGLLRGHALPMVLVPSSPEITQFVTHAKPDGAGGNNRAA